VIYCDRPASRPSYEPKGEAARVTGSAPPERIAVLRTASGKVKVVNRLKEPEHFNEKVFIYRLVDVGHIGMDMLRVRRADERGRDVTVRARILDGQFDDVDTSCPAKRNGFAATLDNRFARGVPSRRSTRGEEAHSGGRRVDDTHAFFLEVRN
jgi:hypothetical protein